MELLMIKKTKLLLITSALLLNGCAMIGFESKTTSYPNDACRMLKENSDWKEAVVDSYDKWKTPISVQLAFVRQESSFRHDARPIRKNKWYEFGENYHSSALGYSQALDGTWADYKKKTGYPRQDRTSFKDSVDFIGWYNYQSRKKLKLSRMDAYSLYLAYHEGWGGYKRGTYNKSSKKFLRNAGWKVNKWAHIYSKQLNKCKLKR